MKVKYSGTYKSIILIIVLGINAVAARGQLKITGRVSDSTHSPLAHATLKLLKDSNITVQTIFSDSTGSFIFPGLAPGNYIIDASYVGRKGVSGRFELN